MASRKPKQKSVRRKKSAARNRQRLIVALGVLLIGFAAVGGYWVADAVFGGTKVAKTQAVTAFVPPPASAPVLDPTRPSPFMPGALYEETLPGDVYEPRVQPKPRTQPQPQTATPTQPDAATDPWRAFAVADTSRGDGPMIAIVIDDMGVDRGRSEKIWHLPAPLTLSFLTYADDLDAQTEQARSAGHELMLHMSMEPTSNTIDAGPNVLISGMSTGELQGLVEWGMDRFKGYVAVNNHMGSRFTQDVDGMRVVLGEIKRRGLFFLDSRTSGRTVGSKVAIELGVQHLERNVFLDNETTEASVLKQLEQTEALAVRRGFAIAIGHPRDATIGVLKTWLPEATARGLRIVPISAVLKSLLDQ